MTLTAAEPRGKSLTALFVDGEFAFSVDTECYLSCGMKPGDAVTDGALHALLRESDARRAERKAVRLLGFRAHSRGELEQKLARTFPREAAARAADRMAQLGLVDDGEYARTLARRLYERKGFAEERVRRELQRRGVDRETAARAARQARPDPGESIRRVLAKKYARGLGDERGRRRAAAALQRMGYRWDEIRAALREYGLDEER